jgi:hypothetical protein
VPEIAFWTSYVALWLLLLAVLMAVVFLYRYHGRMLLNTREGRANQGPEVGKPLPMVRLRDRYSRAIDLGGRRDRPAFVFFASAACEPCRNARSALGEFVAKYRHLLDSVLVCSGGDVELAEFTAELPKELLVVHQPTNDLAAKLRVHGTPFAFVVDREGIVRGAGMPDTLRAFESFVERLHGDPVVSGQADLVPLTIR